VTSLTLEAFNRGVTAPAQRTLDTYGLTQDEWIGLLKDQGWRCPICLRHAKGLKLNTDHEHVRGWKNMPPEKRKEHVRGVLCWQDNHKVVRDHRSSEVVQRVADYLAAYEARRDTA
jgi:hypothetical protein